MPGYERVEITAELTIVAPEGTQESLAAAREMAGASGLAREAGPETILLAGVRREVLEAITKTTEAALDAGAEAVEVKVVAEAEAGKFQRE